MKLGVLDLEASDYLHVAILIITKLLVFLYCKKVFYCS